jgi:hypothetical protein
MTSLGWDKLMQHFMKQAQELKMPLGRGFMAL